MPLNLESAKSGLKDLFDNGPSDDTAWLEGWICGYTDADHCYDRELNDKVHDELFDYLKELRED